MAALPSQKLASPAASSQTLAAQLERLGSKESYSVTVDRVLPMDGTERLRDSLLSNRDLGDSRRNSWVEQSPKAWPYPMVISPNRPVLPGTAW